MRKRVVALVTIVTAILLMVSIPTSAKKEKADDGAFQYRGIPTATELEGKSEEEVSALFMDVMDRQGPAVEASERIHTLFEMDEIGSWIYPDEYAGAYIDEFELYVLLKDFSPDVINKYLNVLGELQSVVHFVQVDYSENELRAMMQQVVDEAHKQGLHLFQYSTQIESNKIVIYVAQCDAESLRHTIAKLGLTSQVNVVECEETDAPQQTAALKGGDHLQVTSTGTDFTLGYCGTYNGYNAVITCGHALLRLVLLPN